MPVLRVVAVVAAIYVLSPVRPDLVEPPSPPPPPQARPAPADPAFTLRDLAVAATRAEGAWSALPEEVRAEIVREAERAASAGMRAR